MTPNDLSRRMSARIQSAIAGLAALSGLVACSSGETGEGCETDLDCKGDRICSSATHTCEDPGPTGGQSDGGQAQGAGPQGGQSSGGGSQGGAPQGGQPQGGAGGEPQGGAGGDPTPLWSAAYGSGSPGAYARDVAAGPNGEVAVCGVFAGTIDFGGGALTVDDPFLSDGFVAVFDAAGQYLWAKHLFSNTNGPSGSCQVGFASDGSLAVALNFFGTVDFGGGSLTGVGEDIAIAKYTSTGAYQWSQRFGGAGDESAPAMAVTPGGDLVLLANPSSGSIDFGGGPISGAGGGDVFIAKLDTTGQHVWSQALGGVAAEFPREVVIDSAGNIILRGEHLGTVDFGDGPLVSSSLDPFLVKLEQDGTFLWSRAVGPQASLFIAPDSLGNVYVTGSFSEEIDLGTGVLGANTSNEVYAGKLDADGEPVWVRQFGGPQGGLITSATAHSAGVVVAGASANGVNLGNGPLAGLFVGMLDQDGDTNWSLALGVPYGSGQVAALAQADDNVVLTGYFNGTLVIGSKSLVSTGDSMFLLELAP